MRCFERGCERFELLWALAQVESERDEAKAVIARFDPVLERDALAGALREVAEAAERGSPPRLRGIVLAVARSALRQYKSTRKEPDGHHQ